MMLVNGAERGQVRSCAGLSTAPVTAVSSSALQLSAAAPS